MSRFIVYSFSSPVEWKNVFEKKDHEIERKIADVAETIKLIYQTCLIKNGVIPTFTFTIAQKETFSSYFSEISQQYYNSHGPVMLSSIRRLGTGTFKIAMVLSALKYWQEINKNRWDGVCKDDEFDTALSLIRSLVSHTANVIKALPNSGSNSNINSTANRYFEFLPDRFNRRLADGVAKSISLNLKTAESYLSKFVKANMLKHEHNFYKKAS